MVRSIRVGRGIDVVLHDMMYHDRSVSDGQSRIRVP